MIHLPLETFDEEVAGLIHQEQENQLKTLSLIASENWVSRSVAEAQSSVFINRSLEGYPGKRYFPGCDAVDKLESIAIERAKHLFQAEHANVQPHSCTQANMAVYHTVLAPGDTFLGMKLDQGGHLSHGSAASFSGRFYRPVPYGVDRITERIDFDELRRVARENRPKLIIAGASAYPRIIQYDVFREVADEVGAVFMADISHIAGLIAANVHPHPFPYADFVTTSTYKTLPGTRGGIAMCKARFAKDLDKSVFPGIQSDMHAQTIASKAVVLKEAACPEFADYAQQIVRNSRRLADVLMDRGFHLVSGGTDTHLLIVDLREKGITGAAAEKNLERSGIYVNRNKVPFDERPALITSGIRMATSVLTRRGMKESEMTIIAEFIEKSLNHLDELPVINQIRKDVETLTKRFPF